MAIKCVLEREIPGVARMEGKPLCTAYLAGLGGEVPEDRSAVSNIIEVDFGAGKPAVPRRPPKRSASSSVESVASWLAPFVAGEGGARWHGAAEGLAGVRAFLGRLRAGAMVAVTPDFELGPGYDSAGELTEAVQSDLEELEQMLAAAEKAGVRFYLCLEG